MQSETLATDFLAINTSSVNNIECSGLIKFANAYRPIHGYLAALIIVFGIPFNLLNIVVLTRPKLISSPTNLILTSLATSDLITMCSTLPYILIFNIIYPDAGMCYEQNDEIINRDTKFWTTYSLIHVNVSITSHGVSIWLTVFLAVFRYIFIRTCPADVGSKKYKKDSKFKIFLKNLTSSKSCLKAIILIVIFCIIYCSPSYFLYYPGKRVSSTSIYRANSTNKPLYVYKAEPTRFNRDGINGTRSDLFKFTFYSQALFAKFIPCCILVTFSIFLIRSLVLINKHKKKLRTKHGMPLLEDKTKLPVIKKTSSIVSFSVNEDLEIKMYKISTTKRNTANNREHLRTTLMLVIVCIFFLVAELPQSILLAVSIIFPSTYDNVYSPLGDVMDITVLFFNSLNFILYSVMSRAFRKTFYDLIMNLLNFFNRNLFCRRNTHVK